MVSMVSRLFHASDDVHEELTYAIILSKSEFACFDLWLLPNIFVLDKHCYRGSEKP